MSAMLQPDPHTVLLPPLLLPLPESPKRCWHSRPFDKKDWYLIDESGAPEPLSLACTREPSEKITDNSRHAQTCNVETAAITPLPPPPTLELKSKVGRHNLSKLSSCHSRYSRYSVKHECTPGLTFLAFFAFWLEGGEYVVYRLTLPLEP